MPLELAWVDAYSSVGLIVNASFVKRNARRTKNCVQETPKRAATLLSLFQTKLRLRNSPETIRVVVFGVTDQGLGFALGKGILLRKVATNYIKPLAGYKILIYLSRETNRRKILIQKKHGYIVRGLLGLLAVVMLLFTIPAYLNTSANPGLANLTGEAASLGSVAGAFLARQLGLTLIAMYGALNGTSQPVLIGAFAMAFLNLHDAIFLSAFGSGGPGAIAGVILGGLAVVVLVLTWREVKA